jgi:hypothetical protein
MGWIKMSVDKELSYVSAWSIEIGSGVVLVKTFLSGVLFVMVLAYVQVGGSGGYGPMRARRVYHSADVSLKQLLLCT